MTDKFKNKYKINSARLKNYNYSQNGIYFITICTKAKKEYFGKVENEKMILNEIGKIAQKFWQEIPNYFPAVKLGEFIIMPNHIHGIIEIINNDSRCRGVDLNLKCRDADLSRLTPDVINHVSTKNKIHLDLMNHVSTLAKAMRWYKGRCSFEISKMDNDINFSWQPRFYEHIIRKSESLDKICEYIKNNPKEWENSKNSSENYVETQFITSKDAVVET